MYAHVFRYTFNPEFPLSHGDLTQFCNQVKNYNNQMKSKNIRMRALTCIDNQAYTQKIPGGIVTYLLFEKPMLSFKIKDICSSDGKKLRICYYMIKDFITGYLESLLYSQASQQKFEINFALAPEGFLYGQLPLCRRRQFITIPYLNYASPHQLVDKTKVVTPKEIKNKQIMVDIGSFLINLYKGFPSDIKPPTSSGDDAFDPFQFKFKNYTDLYLSVNKLPDGTMKKVEKDNYFGLTSEYINTLKAFNDHLITTTKGLADMEKLLEGSFYEFIYKLVMFDPSNKLQFGCFPKALNHPFIQNKLSINQIRSDTSLEKI
jgi:hypothetical protein